MESGKRGLVGVALALAAFVAQAHGATEKLVVELSWATQADIDLVVRGPHGRVFRAASNCLRGPGQERCILAQPSPGNYTIEALCATRRGATSTVVTAQVWRDGVAVGTSRTTLIWTGQRRLVYAVRLAPQETATPEHDGGQQDDPQQPAPRAAPATPDTDPHGFVGTWLETWYNDPVHDTNTIAYHNGRYHVQVVNPIIGPYRITGIRLVGGTLYFTENIRPGNIIDYRIRVRDPNTIVAVVRRRGERRWKAGVTWRRIDTQGAPPPGGAPLMVEAVWGTSADVDLSVFGPSGERYPPLNDCLRGPGREVCLIRSGAPGPYRVRLLNYGRHSSARVAVRVRYRGRTIASYSAALSRSGPGTHYRTVLIGH